MTLTPLAFPPGSKLRWRGLQPLWIQRNHFGPMNQIDRYLARLILVSLLGTLALAAMLPGPAL